MNKKYEAFLNILLYLLVFILGQTIATFIIMIVFFINNIDILMSFTDIAFYQDEIYSFISQYSPVVYIIFFIISFLGYLMVFKAKKRNMIKEVNFIKIRFYKIIVLIFVGVAANIVVDFLLNCVVYFFNLENTFLEYSFFIEKILSSNNVVLLLLSTGILAPVLEEIVFRGFIFNELKKNFSVTKAIFIQAFLFGLVHLNLIQGSYAFLLGLFFAYVYLWTGSIWATVILHISINSYTVLVTKFPQLSTGSLPQLVLSVFVLILGTLIIYKTRTKTQTFF
ncbi:MAG: CPBP family intramembrane metalloprotease [Thermoanaerobacteraceae bacterium]|nr:CPBP family intramembrane metalloprotease [Thermoanaerobacteraceae bacterium]